MFSCFVPKAPSVLGSFTLSGKLTSWPLQLHICVLLLADTICALARQICTTYPTTLAHAFSSSGIFSPLLSGSSCPVFLQNPRKPSSLTCCTSVSTLSFFICPNIIFQLFTQLVNIRDLPSILFFPQCPVLV